MYARHIDMLKSGSTWSLHKHYSPYGGLVLKLKSVISRVLNLILDCYSWVSHYWFLKKTLFFLSGFSNLFNLSFVTFHHFIYHWIVQLISFTIYPWPNICWCFTCTINVRLSTSLPPITSYFYYPFIHIHPQYLRSYSKSHHRK